LRTRWVENGTRELSGRIASRMGITQKEAYSLLRMIGLEMTQMAFEGWIFAIPNFCMFWTYVTIRKERLNFTKKDLQMSGGNVRIKSTENSAVKRKLREINKDKHNETISE